MEDRAQCDVCGEESEVVTSCYLCGKLCCQSCLRISGVCPTCDEMQQDEIGL